MVHDFCSSMRHGFRVYPIKGIPGQKQIWDQHAKRTKFRGQKTYQIGSTTVKDATAAKLKHPPPGPNTIHFPLNYDEFTPEFFKQLTAETWVIKYRNGLPYAQWLCPHGKRNEAWDLLCYNIAVRRTLHRIEVQMELDAFQRVQRPAPTGPQPEPVNHQLSLSYNGPPPPPKPSAVPPGRVVATPPAPPAPPPSGPGIRVTHAPPRPVQTPQTPRSPQTDLRDTRARRIAKLLAR